uniref:Uncharacterized protein n=1 Tax=Pavo cristatus TaxID=9049 RepID=A0A8C9FTB4_PAVCR
MQWKNGGVQKPVPYPGAGSCSSLVACGDVRCGESEGGDDSCPANFCEKQHDGSTPHGLIQLYISAKDLGPEK